MASTNVSKGRIDYTALLELTQKTGLYVACGTLFYVTGYRVMLNNKPNTEFKALYKTINGCDLYTKIENMTSKFINRQAFLITASDYDQTNFKITFEDDELVECYKF